MDARPVRVVFATNHRFGGAALRGMLSSDVYRAGVLDVVLLISRERDSTSGTVGWLDPPAALEFRSIPKEKVASVKEEQFGRMVTEARPDFLLVIGWSELVPGEVLDVPGRISGKGARHGPGHGAIGMHPTLLPKGRGRAPLPWTIIKGLRSSGVSAFLLEEEADAGGVILQEKFSVGSDETVGTLFQKCEAAHFALGKELAVIMAERDVCWEAQDEEEATWWPRRRPEDGLLDLNGDGHAIEREVRALRRPYPGAFVQYRGADVILDEVVVHESAHTHEPGTIVEIRGSGRLPVIAVPGALIEVRAVRHAQDLLDFIPGDRCHGR